MVSALDSGSKGPGWSPGGGALPYMAYRGRAAGQGMVFDLLCPEQGIQFYANLS